MERHLSRTEWDHVFSQHATGAEVDGAAAHLASCGPCWDGAARTVAELKRRGAPLGFQDARGSIVGVLEAEEKAAWRCLLARTSWAARLRSLDFDQQVKRLKAGPALQTREMFDTVLAEAAAVAPGDPWLGEERARAAHALAGLLPEGACPRPSREDLQGAAMLAMARSRRLAADWTGSAAAIEGAGRHFERGTGDPAWEARLLSIQASLASDTGHLERALSLLARAAAAGRRSQDPAVLASLAVQEANIFLYACRYEDALARAEEALALLPRGETRLEMLARSNAVESLVFLERPADALLAFSATQPLYEKVAGRGTELRRGYLDALLLDAFGFAREAERAFRATAAGFLAEEQYKDAFLVFLIFFEILVRKGLLDKAEHACEEALALTRQAEAGCHGQMIELWQDLLSLLRAGRLVKHHLAEAREYLVRCWHAPAAQAPLRQTVRTAAGHVPAGSREREQPRAVPEGREPRPAPAAGPAPETLVACDYREEMERLDRELIALGLAQCGGSVRKAALLLGIAKGTLGARVKKYGLARTAEAAETDGLELPPGGSLPREEQRALLAGMRARAFWEELSGLPARQQIRRIETVTAMRTPEMLDTVLAAARSAALEDPDLGEQRAQVAHTLAGLLPPSFPRPRRADLQGEAMLIAASCRRLAGDSFGSATALSAASRHLGQGTGDAANKARLLSLQAALASDTGQAEEALDLLARAAALCRQAGDSEAASITVQEASTLLAAFRYEAALARAEVALLSLAPGEDRLELLARGIVTESLAQLGRGSEALRSLFTSLPLFQRLRGPRTDLQLGCLEALVLDSLGLAREAEEAFQANVEEWLEAEHYKDALLILLTQFERHYRRGDPAAAKRAGREALRLFKELELEPDRRAPILDLWRDLLALVESQGLTDHKLLEARHFAMAAFAKRPEAQPAKQPARPPVPAGRLLRVGPAAPAEGELAPGDYKRILKHRDRQLIVAALAQCQGQLKPASRLLGISLPTLQEKMWQLRIKV